MKTLGNVCKNTTIDLYKQSFIGRTQANVSLPLKDVSESSALSLSLIESNVGKKEEKNEIHIASGLTAPLNTDKLN